MSRSVTVATPPRGSTTWENAQPVFRTTAMGTGVALGHNGNLVNAAELGGRARAAGLIGTRDRPAATSDSDVIGVVGARAADATLEQAALELLPTVRGAFCLTFMDESTLYAARDPYGVRPLCWGGSNAAGSWRGRPPPWISSARRSSATSSRASCWPSTQTACAPRVSAPEPQGLRLRICVPGPAGQHDRRAIRARHPGRYRSPAGPGASGRGGPGYWRAGIGHPRRRRLRAGIGDPVRTGPDEERLRRADVHPALTNHQAAGHPP